MSLLLSAALLIGSLTSDGASIEPSDASASAAAESTFAGVWQRLAECESTSRWHIANPPYYGGLQMDMVFWRRYGGLEYASRPDLASPAQQIVVARRGLAVQGPGAWPYCSYVAGLR